MKPMSVYDGLTHRRLAFLQNAHNIQYSTHTINLWTGAFSMPYSDSKNEYCQPFNLVDIWDIDGAGEDRYVGLFRIMPREEDGVGLSTGIIHYTLEHVFATLIDDIMLGWHEVGNVEMPTANVLTYILNKQTNPKWTLGICDFTFQYLYGWQDENLLSALMSVVEPFADNDYYWEFETTNRPWRVSLRKTSGPVKIDVRYRKNLANFRKIIDPTNLTTRLYCYGYGDGDNKLNIKNVNNGLPYLDSPNISKYGVITQVWTDERFTVEQSLKDTGVAMLKKMEEPEVTYEIDIHTIHGTADLKVGDKVRVVHERLDEIMVVQQFEKGDVSGAPRLGTILLGYGTQDISNSIAELSQRQRISETYSQGAESIFMDSFYDNADNANPMVASFVVPENAVHVNEIRFSAKLTNFRAYSKATMGGGALTKSSSSGGGATPTSSSGGGGAVTSANGGGASTTSGSGGGVNTTSGGGGENNITSGSTSAIDYTDNDGGGVITTYGTEWVASGSNIVSKYTGFAGGQDTSPPLESTFPNHTHSLGTHQHLFQLNSSELPHSHTVYISTHSHRFELPNHAHVVSLPSHTHSISLSNHTHTVTVPTHTHTVTIPDHTHTVSIPAHTHDITLPDHTHAIEYGIYRGPIASQMQVYLDDKLIGTYAGSVSNINLVDHMQKNSNGNVMRGEHTIRIVPSSLTRIECAYQIRMFTNARDGGQY